MISIAYEVVDRFEKTIAEYAGAKYAVAVDSCCNALFLSCVYLKVKRVIIPRFTYPGVACSIIHAGGEIKFSNDVWEGAYELAGYRIFDSALRFRQNMYIHHSFYCLSFHAKKNLPIGRGGMILCDDKRARDWLRRARFDGRNPVPLSQDKIEMVGWNMYMTPEQAARGLMLFDIVKDKPLLDLDRKSQGYPDLSGIKAYEPKTNSCFRG